MARWDEILSLPVQNPPTLEFSSADLVWSKVEGWRDKTNRVVLIPFARVDDFVRGESANKECPTRFHVEARRRRPPEMAYKPKVDGILEYILYWCSFGPDDHRKGGIVRPSRTTYVPKKKNAGRPNTKRGCTCHFIVKRLIAEPSVALIIYNDDKHIDKKGLPCHGPQDKKAAGTRAMFAPYISEDLRLRVLSLLYVGVSVETIMQRHNESVERQGGPCNRDDLLTHRYVRRQERSIRRSTYELDADDAVSIRIWVESHQEQVFYFEDFADSEPFTLGIQTEWQLQQMIRFGNRSLLAADSRFGTNKLKYPIHSLLVFNSDNKAIPVAWIIAPRDVFECSVLICFWRIRHAWHKNLVKKCLATDMQVEISRRLGQAVDNICRGLGTVGLFEDLLEDLVDESEFMDYFKAIWYPRIGSWTAALKSLPLASQETCAAMEFYHNQLKLRLLNEKGPDVFQRVDWLVDKLGTKVHSYFWLDEYSGKDDFARYWKDEWVSGLTSWRKALKIPDSDVVIESRCAKVTDQLDRDKAYVVWNPGSQFGICNCGWAEMGNLCEHMFKVINLCRKRGSTMPSISLFQYHKALIDMLHCPPHDSLIRDHAISLAVCVQKQLNSIVDFDSDPTILHPIQVQSVDNIDHGSFEVVFANQDRKLEKQSNCMDEDVSAHDENCGDINGVHGSIKGDGSGELIDMVGCGNGICAGSAREEISCADMDVEPSSICISPPGLYSVDEVVASNVFSENGDRVLTNTGSNNVSSKDAFIEGTGFQAENLNKDFHETMMDVEPSSIDVAPETPQSQEQCTVTHPNCVADNDVFSIPDTETKTSSSISFSVESKVIDMVETSDVIKENEAMELESGNGSINENQTLVVNALPVDGGANCIGDDSHIGDDTKAVGSMMADLTESSQRCSSMENSTEKHWPSQVSAHEAICQPLVVDSDNGIAGEGTVSGETAHASPASTGSNKYQPDAGVAASFVDCPSVEKSGRIVACTAGRLDVFRDLVRGIVQLFDRVTTGDADMNEAKNLRLSTMLLELPCLL
ncbi:hypothetical protein CJ030_MR1G025749 [Morella rubra]|uniref:SWIM-type domain-containing protein n=1 Tax=Morella rubra TaxID=262757 RepID=A0A6A1WNB2_9ROSI|nr:hypothetical protein CJ030_MR1G025749 [Morella rubra]